MEAWKKYHRKRAVMAKHKRGTAYHTRAAKEAQAWRKKGVKMLRRKRRKAK